jgi:hypothetical protein
MKRLIGALLFGFATIIWMLTIEPSVIHVVGIAAAAASGAIFASLFLMPVAG